MRKNSITRFDSENIAFVDFDTDTKEGVAGVIDEVNGQTYPFSGGAAFLIDPQEITISIPDNPFPEIQVNDGGEGELPSVEFILLKAATGEDSRDYYVLAQQSVNVFEFSDGSMVIDLICNSDTHIWNLLFAADTGGDDPEPIPGTFTFSAVGTW